jgi:hypothetical protein
MLPAKTEMMENTTHYVMNINLLSILSIFLLLKSMLECGVNLLELVRPILAYSARGILHKGHYQDCLEQPEMKYALIDIGSSGASAGVYFGLCLPRACSDKLITNSVNSLLQKMQIPLEIIDINSDSEHYTFPLSWVSYLTIFILMAIAVLVFTATVKGYKAKLKNKWLQCFDVFTNLKHFDVRPKEDLNALDGVRALSMMWVVIGHSFSIFIAAIVNITDYSHLASHPFELVLMAGILSVDVFLALGGFFLAFIMLRHTINLKVCGLGILQRALRIWPAYILAMMFYFSLIMRLGSGPFWSKIETSTKDCHSMWR